MKRKRFFAWVLIAALMLTGVGFVSEAKAEDTVSWESYLRVEPGAKTTFEMGAGSVGCFMLPVQQTTTNMYLNSGVVAYVETESGIFEKEYGELVKDEDNVAGIFKMPHFGKMETTMIKFTVHTSNLAKIGVYNAFLVLKYQGRYYDGDLIADVTEARIPFKIRITEECSPAQLTVVNPKYDVTKAFVGQSFELEFDTKNEGDIEAVNAAVSIDFGDSGIVPDYAAAIRQLGTLARGESKHLKLPVLL